MNQQSNWRGGGRVKSALPATRGGRGQQSIIYLHADKGMSNDHDKMQCGHAYAEAALCANPSTVTHSDAPHPLGQEGWDLHPVWSPNYIISVECTSDRLWMFITSCHLITEYLIHCLSILIEMWRMCFPHVRITQSKETQHIHNIHVIMLSRIS